MSKLSEIREILIPAELVERTQGHLREAGTRELEGVALWAGEVTGQVFNVSAVLVPNQQAFNGPSGLYYVVDSMALHRVNVWLFENSLQLIAQVHSHPGEAYHSPTDDSYPMVTTIGSLSIVVPDFARNPFNLSTCAAYQLSPNGKWEELDTEFLIELIKIR